VRAIAGITIAMGAALVGSCSTAEQGSATAGTNGRQCFYVNSVNGFNAVNDTTVIVDVGANRSFALDIAGACPNLDWSQKIGIRTTGNSFVCSGFDAELVVPGVAGSAPWTCPVNHIRELSPEEAKALLATKR